MEPVDSLFQQTTIKHTVAPASAVLSPLDMQTPTHVRCCVHVDAATAIQFAISPAMPPPPLWQPRSPLLMGRLLSWQLGSPSPIALQLSLPLVDYRGTFAHAVFGLAWPIVRCNSCDALSSPDLASYPSSRAQWLLHAQLTHRSGRAPASGILLDYPTSCHPSGDTHVQQAL